jgi:stalled ribosome rescue protein Dom34
MKQVGLWIDHRRAVIVTLSGQGGKDDKGVIEQIDSDMEKHVRFSGGGGMQDGAADNQVDRRYDGHLDKYYDRVAEHLKDADAILLLGPGEAKGEMRKLLVHLGHGDLVAGVETADKLTDNQIAAVVREHFHK